MDRTTLDAWVGIFVVIGIAALFVLALKVGNAGDTLNMKQTYTVYAEFENIGGLKVRAPVKGAGVVVGRVSDIDFDTKKFVARVELKLDKRYEFPKDTSVSILTSGLLGEQYIGLEAGGDTAMLKNGDTLKLTQSAVVLEKLIGQFLYSKAAEGGGGGDKAPPSVDKAPPTVDKAPPTVDKALPSGDKAPLSGDKALPSGDKASSGGDKKAPFSGDKAPPSGDKSLSSGDKALSK